MHDLFDKDLPVEAQPQVGDSQEMLMFRKVMGALHKLHRVVADNQGRLAGVEPQVEAAGNQANLCVETLAAVNALRASLFPEGKPESHVTLRVRSLEADRVPKSHAEETHRLIKDMHGQLFPATKPELHITARVAVLEKERASWKTKGWAIAQAVIIASLVGLGAATVSAASDLQKIKSSQLAAPPRSPVATAPRAP